MSPIRKMVVLLWAMLICVEVGKAQSALLKLPDASQQARLTQRIGLTDITIDYHRPLVHGRKIFGGLIAYDQVWRAGANQNTVIEFSDPVTIDGQALPAGRYGLHMISGETSWVVIFSKNSSSWGSFTYDKAEDALRVTVRSQPADSQEALRYDFDELQPNSATITMRWEKIAVPFKVQVNTAEAVEQSLHKQLRGRVGFEWQAWTDAANYLLNNNLNPEEALKYADHSIDIEDRFENEFTKSRALDVLGKKEEARAAHDRAVALGNQSQIHDYGRGLQAQGQQDEALELFLSNVKKDPTTWIAHNEAARIAVAKGDFDTALKEMKLATAESPASLKNQHADLVRRLENKDDINR